MPDFIRLYTATSLECTKCDNWEEGDAPWSCFDWTYEEHSQGFEGATVEAYYTCNACGTNCITESEIREWRDYE